MDVTWIEKLEVRVSGLMMKVGGIYNISSDQMGDGISSDKIGNCISSDKMGDGVSSDKMGDGVSSDKMGDRAPTCART